MPRSIRDEILIPLVVIQAVAVTATAFATANLAAKRSERGIVERLNGVVATLGHANFPYTGGVLARMHGLTGAHFVAYSPDGQIGESSLPGLDGLSDSLRSVVPAALLGPLGGASQVDLRGTRYLATALQPSVGRDPRGLSLLVLYPEASWRQARFEAALPPLLLGLAALILMSVVTGWVAHRTGLRLRRIQRHVAGIARGRFDHLDPGPIEDEVADLSRSINWMCDQLNEMRDDVRRNERTRLLAQLGAGLAHQLRNALTGARMSVQLHLRRCPVRDGDRSLEVALRQLAMTQEQVNGLLSLGRIERRPAEACDVRGLLADVALLVDPSCQHAGVTLRTFGEGPPLEILADPSALRAAVLNLTLNAIEAAGNRGTVWLEATDDGDRVLIEVRDTGPGPPPRACRVAL